MTRSKQVLRELYHLEAFRSRCTVFPDGAVTAQGNSFPDFLVPTHHLGIEVTELRVPEELVGENLSAQEACHDGLALRAQLAFQRRRPERVVVSADVGRIARSDYVHFAGYLADAVERNLPDHGHQLTLSPNRENRHGWPKGLHSITIWHPEDFNDGLWSLGGMANYPPQCVPAIVQDRIDAKNQKAIKYAGNASELWLLLVLDDDRPSGHFIIGDEVYAHTYNSEFSRVWLLHCMQNAVNELKVR